MRLLLFFLKINFAILQVQVMEDEEATRTGLFPTGYPHADAPPLVSTSFFAQDSGR